MIFFSIETAKVLNILDNTQTRRNVYQMQFNFKRILAVLGLSISLRMVKDGSWPVKQWQTPALMVSAVSLQTILLPGTHRTVHTQNFCNTQLFPSSFSRCAQGSSSPNPPCHATVASTSLSNMPPAAPKQWKSPIWRSSTVLLYRPYANHIFSFPWNIDWIHNAQSNRKGDIMLNNPWLHGTH